MILIYGKSGCPHCVEAKALAESKGLQYTYTSIGQDMMLEDFKELFPSHDTDEKRRGSGEENGF